MNRRTFLGVATAAVLSPALPEAILPQSGCEIARSGKLESWGHPDSILFCELPTGPITALHTFEDKLLAFTPQTIYTIDPDGTYREWPINWHDAVAVYA